MEPKLYEFTPEVFCRFFFDYLCGLRKRNHISQEIAGDNAGMSQQRISNFEKHAVQPNLYTIFKYIRATGLSHAEVFSMLDRIVVKEQKFFYVSEPPAMQN